MNRKVFVSIMLITGVINISWLILEFRKESKEMITIPMAVPAIEENRLHNMWGGEFTEDDLHCLALNIYFEARSEEPRGQYAVAEVVMYRLLHDNYPDTVCDVIQSGRYYEWNPEMPVRHMCQFSWWCDGLSDYPANGKAYTQALGIARDVLENPFYESKIGYAVFYHALSVDPYWVDSVKFVETVGYHSFYR